MELPQQLCTDGKRRSVMRRSKDEAIARARQRAGNDGSIGLDRNAGTRRSATFLTGILAYYKHDGGVAPSTYQDYRYHIESHVVPVLETRIETKGSRSAWKVDEFTRALNQKEPGDADVAILSYSVLRQALQFAVDWKYIPINPASSRMRAAKRRTRRKRTVQDPVSHSRKMRASFWRRVRGDRYEALYVLAITTGMRQK